MPGPSWRPFLGAFGVFALFLGLVFGGWLLAVGRHRPDRDAGRLAGRRGQGVPRDRSRRTRPATSRTSRPRQTPSRLFGGLVVLIVGAAVLQCRASSRSARPAAGPARRARRVRRRRARGSGGLAARAGASGAPPPAGAGGRRPRSRPRASRSSRRRSRHRPASRSRSPSTTRTRACPHNIEIKDASGDVGLQGRDLQRRRRRRSTTSRRCRPARTRSCAPSTRRMTGTATLQ